MAVDEALVRSERTLLTQMDASEACPLGREMQETERVRSILRDALVSISRAIQYDKRRA